MIAGAVDALGRIEHAARRLALADTMLRGPSRTCRRHLWRYHRARATAELRALWDRWGVERVEIHGARVVRCGSGFRCLEGGTAGVAVVIEAPVGPYWVPTDAAAGWGE